MQPLTEHFTERMMKRTLLLPLIIFFFAAAEKKVFTTNEHVTIEMQGPSRIPAGKTGGIKFFFTPIDGIHINTEPKFELKLGTDSKFEIAGEPRYARNEKEYLEIKKPIEFSVKAKSGIQPGKYPLKGTLYYFYCSDAEGWCNRFAQPVDITITVTR